ncbi:MAG: hypothetical protein JSV63_01580 [Candidatus Aenigmatarchaeota archaeon]|nr:MAG: hypothetical protein JSV63_01580 [Candidatus Aenigmarchaeota archaeon]
MKPTGFTKSVYDCLTGPCIFIVAGLVYLAASTAAAFDPSLGAGGMDISTSSLAFLVFLFGLISFYIGVITSRSALRLSYLPVMAGIFLAIITGYFVLGLCQIFAVVFALSVLLVSYVLLFSKINWEYAFTAGTFLLWLSYVLNGIPLTDMNLHRDLFTHVNPIFMTGFFLMTYSLARMHPKRRYLWLFLLFSLALSTFRLYLGIAFITWVLLEIKEMGDKKASDLFRLWSIGLVTGAVILTFVFIGHSMMDEQHPEWNMDPLRTAEYRLAFTMSVFDDIVHLSFPFGYTYGGSLTMESTEFISRTLYGYDARITATSFGEAMLNFGLAGVFLVAWWAGAVLANLRRIDYRLYAVLMAMLISTLDVGINVFVILGLIYLGWMRVMSVKEKSGILDNFKHLKKD